MKDIANRRFGKLTALQIDHIKKYPNQTKAYWLCRCDCGNNKVVRAEHLSARSTISCGCAGKKNNERHGLSSSKEYNSWIAMRNRCYNPKNNRYHIYGGRGIIVCDRWQKFENFIADVGFKPSPIYSLDRINTDGNYEPSNVRWATPKQQANNRRALASV